MSQHGSTRIPVRSTSSLMALVPTWDSGEQTLLLSGHRTFRAGRARDCDLMIRHPGIAALHATLHQDKQGVFVQPEGGHSVRVNDLQVAGRHSLQVGDQVAFGPATFRIEARRAVRRSQPAAETDTRTAAVSARLERHLNELQEQFDSPNPSATNCGPDAGEFDQLVRALSGPPPQLPPTPPPTIEATPVLDGLASTNRSSALDERESQLNAWHESLDKRREELDRRSANLTRQQSALTNRQTELDHRTLEIESWHAAMIQEIEDSKRNLNRVAESELQQKSAELQHERQELEQQRNDLSAQLKEVEDSKQRLAQERQALQEAQAELHREQAALSEEREQFNFDIEERRLADEKQETVFDQERRRLDEIEQQLQQDRTDLKAQEERLQEERKELLTRSEEVSQLEDRLKTQEEEQQLQASESSAAEEQEPQPGAITVARQLLEEQKTNLSDQQGAVQQQLDEIQRREAELEWLREDLDQQRAQLLEHQISLEYEREEAAIAVEEARRLQRDFEEFTAQIEDELNDDCPHTENPQGEISPEQQEAWEKRERELQGRAEELAQRVSEVKALRNKLSERQSELESREQSSGGAQQKSALATQLSSLLMPGVSESTDASPVQDDEELLHIIQKNEELQAERSELVSRISELEEQLQEATADHLNVSALLDGGVFETTSRALTENKLLEQLQALKSELDDSQEDGENDLSRDGEKAVVQSQITELEARNAELSESHAQEILKYQETIDQLNEQLEAVRQQFEDLEQRALQAVGADQQEQQDDDESADDPKTEGADSETVGKLKEMVQQLSEKLEQRNNTIDNLQAQLNGGIPADPSLTMTPQEMRVQEHELNARTVVLDKREEACRERERMLEQEEQELQTQRFALQEARQQLERARAEIQQIHKPEAPESMLVSRDLIDSVAELAEAGAVGHEQDKQLFSPAEPNADSPGEGEGKVQDEAVQEQSTVRSEIAELFGLTGKSQPSSEKTQEPTPAAEPEPEPAPSTAAEMMAAVDDYSQEAEAAVSLSFENAQDMLIKPEDAAPESGMFSTSDSAKSDSEDEAEDVVASYMEQLLSRSRTKANGEAPQELQRKPDSGPPKKKEQEKKEEPQKKPGNASFIEKYMAGEYGGDAEVAKPVEAEELTTEEASAQQLKRDESAELRRSKIDREALRNDLKSLRELSTLSAANALATHARRQQKGGITTRTTILTTLSLICVFIICAALMGVIPFGWLAALSIISVIVSGGELAYKLKQVRKEVQQKSQLLMEQEENDKMAKSALAAEATVEPPSSSPAISNTVSEPIAPEAVGEAANPTENVADDVAIDPTSEVEEQLKTSAVPSAPAASDLEADPKNSIETTATLEALQNAGVPAEGESSQSAGDTPAKEEGAVHDAFNEAFRMLTATSIPVNNPAKDEATKEEPKGDS